MYYTQKVTPEKINQEDRDRNLYEQIVADYLRYGSVDKVVREREYPVSYVEIHRIISKWGIVKATGRSNTKMSEILSFLSYMAHVGLPLESLYKEMPPSFQPSLETLYRILHCVKEEVIRRVGTAVVITPFQNPGLVLVANDISTPRIELGKPYGSLSLPMGFSSKYDSPNQSILRVCQQEVFTRQTIKGNFPYSVLSEEPEPLMKIDIADVRVCVYSLELPRNLGNTRNFWSYKLTGYKFVSVDDLAGRNQNLNLRAGIKEIAMGYQNFLRGEVSYQPQISILNQELLNYSAAFTGGLNLYP
ncbi:hypothetical protein A3D00_00940 [Candidatus Woesebacteria bacterium RIFCSPHIGHO2_02_FULL_38_9]|uniref:Uncharacterized protein n=1 Tax=Candidatus Woesebacteria bacterium RIFCSPHIGHO2_01_FULL_39_28 TaxID=1802496 RepID=A0A1F7YH52_9BACT|nr:MAG: hypothetical protein A2627_02270 [Candidatus Woesebacteria bacterium RIFCSPHIGHO2_01_FULL_39_28]OGM31423.1 MAG: hypothetical protein A3D00_00940 [Candidatus Woesebacteria bacterium RIFCSPHIGHO2_02_FULL_38_9]